MATTASDIVCHGCYEPGHIRRNCPKIKNRAKKKTKPAGATKWCSKHNTTSHSDEECYQQGGKRPGDTKDSSKAFTACSNCTHCSSASNKHDSNNEVAVVDFTRDEDALTAALCSPRFPHLRTQLLHRGRPGRHGSIGDHATIASSPTETSTITPSETSKDRGRGRRKPTQRQSYTSRQ